MWFTDIKKLRSDRSGERFMARGSGDAVFGGKVDQQWLKSSRWVETERVARTGRGPDK